MNQSNPLSPNSSDTTIGVIGIVASLGGIEAVTQVLANLPADFPVPILLLQHLGRGQSHLVEILSRKSRLLVRWASHADLLGPATVYVAPPDYSLHAHPDGTISLVPLDDLIEDDDARTGWPAAEAFLRSLAFSYEHRTLALVLSGLGKSGASGVQEVKRQGGMVFAQDESSSYRWSMPRAAIDTGCVDLVLPLHEIAPVLLDLVCKGTGLPRSPQELQASEALFAGGGATGALLHSIDWSRTALGRVLSWEATLRVAVRIMLVSPQPLAIFWGPELIRLYNDAYSTLLGDAHPQALGEGLGDSRGEGADLLLPLIDQVRRTGRAVERADQPFFMRRHGVLHQEYATFSLSPIRDEEGNIAGFLLTARRTTDQQVSERRLHTLSELGGVKAQASSPRQAYEAAALVLADNPADIPFALLYRFDETRQRALVGGITGLPAGGPASPRAVDLNDGSVSPWPLEQVARTGKALRVDHLPDRVPGTAFPETAQTAFLLPLSLSPDAPPVGCAVMGTNPRFILDPAYRNFLDLVTRQIAQNVQAAQQLEEARQQAEALAELNRVKSEFFSNISHEFRTPLTLLLGPLEDLLTGTHGDLSGPQHAAVELAHRNSLRLLKQVNTLLDFSRIEAGRMRARFEPVDLAALTNELVSGFRPAIERAGLRLVVDCSPLPEPVLVDSEMWEKILLNLLSNALKFTFAGEIAVRLHPRPNHVELTVRDTGIGIPKAHLPHLFERFYRVPGSRGRSGEGSGIGLALVDELVRLHRGAVRVESQPEQGSIFTVWLPRKPRTLQEKPVGQPVLSTATGVTPFVEEASQWAQDDLDRLSGELMRSDEPLSARSPGARVLVADDNADMRDYLRRLLGQYWTVETVGDGEEALAALDRMVPDLVLADVMMPKVDGFGLLRRIRERPQIATLPIILVTARAGEEAAIEGLLAGADDYITKPFSARELVARVGAQLELARLRRESQAAIERSEAFLRAAVEASGVGVWELDVRTNRLSLSERAYELLGIETDGEDTRAAVTAYVHLDDRERIDQAQAQALDPSGDGFYRVEYRVLHPSGRLLWLESRGRTSFEERADGRHPVVLRGALLDISERKRAEEHLRRAAALDAFRFALADVLRPVGDSTAIKNEASRVLREHLGAARVVYCDISDDEVAEVTGGDWAPGAVRNSERFELCHWGTLTDRLRAGRTIHSDNVRNAPDLSEAEKAAYAVLSSGAWAFTPLVKDSRLVATVAVQFTEPHVWTPDELGLLEETAGRIWAAVERARAEQALRESEARFRALVTATSYVVYRMSPDWEEMRQLDGRGFIADTWSPNKTWLGKYIHPDDQPHVMEVIRQAIRTKGVFELEHRVLRVDGTLGWTLSRAVPLLNSAGEITEWFGAASDVTARKQAEEALRESEEKYRTLTQ